MVIPDGSMSFLVWVCPGEQEQLRQVDVGAVEVPLGAEGQGQVVREEGDPGGQQVSRGQPRVLVPAPIPHPVRPVRDNICLLIENIIRLVIIYDHI